MPPAIHMGLPTNTEEAIMSQIVETHAKKSVRQVFTISERNGKSFWIKIGASFVNKDGSETVLLDALPVNGRMQIREVLKTPAKG